MYLLTIILIFVGNRLCLCNVIPSMVIHVMRLYLNSKYTYMYFYFSLFKIMARTHGLLLLFISMCQALDTINIKTPLGGLRGRVEEHESKKILQFLNIPYAEPPIGTLRFADPVANKGWKGVRSATEFGHICPQELAPMGYSKFFYDNYKQLPSKSEDCLSLNVYVPEEITTEKLRPVMFFIHGGGYTLGDSPSYDGTYLALGGDVIVVTINYRLGALGFFSTADDTATGNQGLKDQQLAMKWVHENIKSFGGDPEAVTIFGESAGSFSVAHHIVNAQNNGLFQRAILQSGSNAGNIGLCTNLRESATTFGIDAGCLDEGTTAETLNSEELLNCLRGLPSDQIVKVQNILQMKLMGTGSISNCFNSPVIDERFILLQPTEVYAEKNTVGYAFFRTIDIIAGTTNMEGAFITGMLMTLQEAMNFTAADGVPYDVMCNFGSSFMPMVFEGSDLEVVRQKICEKLKSDNNIEQGINLVKLISDMMFTVPMKRLINSHADGNNQGSTYEYLFSYEWDVDMAMTRVGWIKGQGADHTSELMAMFGPKGLLSLLTTDATKPEMAIIRQQMVKYWTNFAKTG